MSYFGIPQVDEGEDIAARTADLDTRSLLVLVLMELKKLNLYMANLTSTYIDDTEV